jgi:hypothetical protein
LVFLTACAQPVVVQSREGRFYKSPQQILAEAVSICKTQYGKKGAKFNGVVFGHTIGDPASRFFCTD